MPALVFILLVAAAATGKARGDVVISLRPVFLVVIKMARGASRLPLRSACVSPPGDEVGAKTLRITSAAFHHVASYLPFPFQAQLAKGVKVRLPARVLPSFVQSSRSRSLRQSGTSRSRLRNLITCYATVRQIRIANRAFEER